MENSAFGTYYKKIRTEKKITQDYVANKVKRKKMTISLIESGKNEPPTGELLLEMINALGNISEEEKANLLILSAKSRKLVPIDISEYFFSNPEIYFAIKRGLKKNKKNVDWTKIF